jgi:hypothetical protein
MNIMEQNTIDEHGSIIPKERLTHDQSFKWSSGTSVNSRVDFDKLLPCQYGACLRRLANYAVAARRKYPNKRILATKVDYKSAYRRCHLNHKTAVQTIINSRTKDWQFFLSDLPSEAHHAHTNGGLSPRAFAT